MSQSSKKSARSYTGGMQHGHTKKPQPVYQPFQSVQQAEEKVLEMGRGGLDNLMHATGDIGRTVRQCAGICSGTVNAVMETGDKTTRIVRDIGKEVVECGNRAFAEWCELSRKAAVCKAPTDFIELQSKAVQLMYDNYFHTSSKLSELLFDSYTEALEPLSEHIATASEQLRKVMAA